MENNATMQMLHRTEATSSTSRRASAINQSIRHLPPTPLALTQRRRPLSPLLSTGFAFLICHTHCATQILFFNSLDQHRPVIYPSTNLEIFLLTFKLKLASLFLGCSFHFLKSI